MKKKYFILCCLLFLVLLGGCRDKKNTEGKVIHSSIKEIIQLMDENQTFIFYIGQTTCASCKEFRPIAEQFAKSNEMNIYYLEMDTEDENEFTSFKEKYTPKLLYTPTAFVVIDGEITEFRVVSNTSYRKFKEWLSETGVLK